MLNLPITSNRPMQSAQAAAQTGRGTFLAAALASLLCPACSHSEETTASSIDNLVILTRQRLNQTSAVVDELSRVNGTLNKASYEHMFVRLINAFNLDLTHSYGAQGLAQYSRFKDLKIDPSAKAAHENGLVLTYYPTVSSKGDKYAIHVIVKVFGSQEAESPKPAYPGFNFMPVVDVSAVPVVLFESVLHTPNFPTPVGTLIKVHDKHTVLIDERQIQHNARTARLSENDLVGDVYLNEIAHYAFLRSLGLSASELNNKSVTLAGTNNYSFIEIQEAFSDLATFSFGKTSIDYYIMFYPDRAAAGQYALTNDLFMRGLKRALTDHSDILATKNLRKPYSHQELAQYLRHDPELRALQPAIKQTIAKEFYDFFSANWHLIETTFAKN